MKKTVDVDRLKIGVVGAGSWGTAIANLLGDKGFKVHLWAFEKEIFQEIYEVKENKTFLPSISLSPNIIPSNDLAEVVSEKDLIILVVPSQHMREISSAMTGYVSKNAIVVSASKGIENKTHLRMTGILRETLPISKRSIAVLSGPTFAKEVAMKVPSVVTVAAKSLEIAIFIQNVLATSYFRVYTSNDIVGVELGGAVKNVIAIATGISDGLGLGLNTRAAIVTRGQTEIRRLGLKLGANPRTFTGLAGIGDLVLTCTGDLSRNHTVGKKIGEGKKLQDILSEMRMVAEGVKTSKSVYNLSKKKKVDMPISHTVYRVLYEDLLPKDAVYQLMTRDLKNELDEY
ncbi:MAG: NAD(P)-dependent glycerol-3-phosphate dehydrogenase [Deltaproteobacteria bacterium]|nr:NAD(P)-dependent glycerol-3-phosphate dehydrogenase [Deltaproteobacteria bacterium]MBW1983497.1 NAD(P)-dependent glycerol-3-phosphate dehydrogenase [Deltaproteobacteria bacterium]MBW2179989.1 NAD(P)-dependent glycerol-3-phosphate dehydrogenase [Deltaproteobacteria bacterium]